jgi:hypothetical protein
MLPHLPPPTPPSTAPSDPAADTRSQPERVPRHENPYAPHAAAAALTIAEGGGWADWAGSPVTAAAAFAGTGADIASFPVAAAAGWPALLITGADGDAGAAAPRGTGLLRRHWQVRLRGRTQHGLCGDSMAARV